MAQAYFSAPTWVESKALKARKYDILGLRNPTQTIGNLCLNGIITITPQIRYLSLRVFIVYLYAKCELPNSEAAFRRFADKIEAAFALGMKYTDPEKTGVIGATKALEIIKAAEPVIRLEKLVKSQTAVTIYSNISTQLGIYASDSHSPITPLTQHSGGPLSALIFNTLKECSFVRRIIQTGEPDSISFEEIIELGEVFSLYRIPENERQQLTRVLLPDLKLSPTFQKSEYYRLATYTALLALAKDLERPPIEDDLLKIASSPKIDNPDIPQEILDGWLAFLIRDTLAFAHEKVLELIIREIKRVASIQAHAAMVIDKIVEDQTSIESTLIDFGVLHDGEDYEGLEFNTVFERLTNQIVIVATDSLFNRWDKPELSEARLLEYFKTAGPEKVAVLPILWMITELRLKQGHTHPFIDNLSRYGNARLGLNERINPSLAKWKNENPPYHEVVKQLIQTTVDQHTRIAWSRMANDPKKDITVIHVDGAFWQFKEIYTGSRTDARISQAVGWLSQLDLISENGITSNGLLELDRCLSTLKYCQGGK